MLFNHVHSLYKYVTNRCANKGKSLFFRSFAILSDCSVEVGTAFFVGQVLMTVYPLQTAKCNH